MKNKLCPACGGKNIVLNQKDQILKESFGGQQIIKIKEYICSDCGSSGDFFNENDSIIQSNLLELKSKAVINILEDFIHQKISLSSIERALELPQRTLTKWKNKNANPTSTGVALLKFLRLFPWLLEVAENKFEYNTAQKISINVAFQKIINKMCFNENDFREAGVIATAQSTFLYLNYQNLPEENINFETMSKTNISFLPQRYEINT